MNLILRSSCAAVPTSNLLGVTGLTRASLRALFAETGLFGRDSDLSLREQRAVYAELQLPAGSVPPSVTSGEVDEAWRIAALRSFVRAVLLQGGDAAIDQVRALALSFGIPQRVLRETERVMRNATLVFGASRPATSDVKLVELASDVRNPATRRAYA